MHPYWIQKIEESRKTAVTTFWVSMFLVVLVPLMLVLKGDAFLILAMICFFAAALRAFWKDDKKYTDVVVGVKQEADIITEYRTGKGTLSQTYRNIQEVAAETGIDAGQILEDEMQAQDTEDFFSVNMESGQPLEESPEYRSMDDMQLADPQTHPHDIQNRYQATRQAASRS